MFSTVFKHFYLLVIITGITYRAHASRCGLFNCDAQAECKYNLDTNTFYCVCEEGLVENRQGNHIQCLVSKVQNCLKVGAECGPHHTCNTELICQKMRDNDVEIIDAAGEDIVCVPQEKKCLDKCCLENETCQNGRTCIVRETAPKTSMAAIRNDCPENQKCLNKCCASTELCQNGKECVDKDYSAVNCSPAQFCLDRCCAEQEICSIKENICVSKDNILKNKSNPSECPEQQLCKSNCCALNEKCNSESRCVGKEETITKCPESLKCLDKCCARNEVCTDNKMCVSQYIIEQDCPKSRKCTSKCCAIGQMCNDENECEEEHEQQINIRLADTSGGGSLSCSETQTCIGNTGECHEMCGNKCCPVNETCNDANECVIFIEVTTSNNCPEHLQCANDCCSPQQICNSKNRCVDKNLAEISNLYDFSNEEVLSEKGNVNNIEAIIPLVNWNENKESMLCPTDHFPCQNTCCSNQQICNPLGECEEQLNDPDPVCMFGKNCTENAEATNNRAAITYTMIGLGCLVTVLTFALFKLYNFRRTHRHVF